MTLDIHSFPKIDGHMHFNSPRENILELADQYGFSFITINTEVPFFPDIDQQQIMARNFPKNADCELQFISTVSTEHIGDRNWADQAIKQISENMANGALGVKFWKNIGMSIQRKDGSFVMLDDAELKPVFEYLAEQQIPVLGHLGEPRNCWLPVEEMTVKSDRDYFAAHPEYHMFKLPDYPDYWDHIKSRDAILERHPNLTFVGAHIGSLEWNLDEVAKRLDRYPNFVVDLAERIMHLYYHAAEDRQKVIDFFNSYQNRIIYGTDIIDDPDVAPDIINKELERRWSEEWLFLSTDTQMNSVQIESSFQGLGLSHDVLEKIYRLNAQKWYNLSS